MTKRLNRVISLMENDKPAFGTFVSNGNLDEITESVDLGFDFVIIENEHAGMDFQELRISLQFLLDRRRIQAGEINEVYPTPLVRVSPNAEEISSNQWVIKQTLDLGAFGLLIPKLETIEAAQQLVDLCRYPVENAKGDIPSEGKRGWGPKRAARYWGLSIDEYVKSSTLWPLDPQGELLIIGICESALGLRNLPDILSQVKGIGAV
jgi:4-hydroxy-2-oxoheptanedioate aldolase